MNRYFRKNGGRAISPILEYQFPESKSEGEDRIEKEGRIESRLFRPPGLRLWFRMPGFHRPFDLLLFVHLIASEVGFVQLWWIVIDFRKKVELRPIAFEMHSLHCPEPRGRLFQIDLNLAIILAQLFIEGCPNNANMSFTFIGNLKLTSLNPLMKTCLVWCPGKKAQIEIGILLAKQECNIPSMLTLLMFI